MYWNNKQLQQRTFTIRTDHVCQYHSVSVWYTMQHRTIDVFCRQSLLRYCKLQPMDYNMSENIHTVLQTITETEFGTRQSHYNFIVTPV